MEALAKLMETFQAANTGTTCEPVDMAKYLQSRCDAYNAMAGGLSGEDCPVCRNKGFVAYLDGMEEKTRECRCMVSRRALWRMESSGLGDLLSAYTFDSYRADEAWQKPIWDGAHAYLDDYTGKWWYIGGQVGAGKTHICTAITGEMLRRGMEARYMLWRDEATALKAVVNDDTEYQRLIAPLKTVQVLYIDDFWKTGGAENGGKKFPTPGDINLAFEILNSRYNRPELVTILSGEWTTDELMGIDAAVGSRIYQRAKDYHFDIKRDPARNHRMKRDVPVYRHMEGKENREGS